MHGKPDSYREFFIKKWADYIISNENWSVLQAKFINAQIKNIKSEASKLIKIEQEKLLIEGCKVMAEEIKKITKEFEAIEDLDYNNL